MLSLSNNTNFNIENYLSSNENKLYIHFPSYYVEAKDLIEPIKKNIHTEIFKLNPKNMIETNLEFSTLNFNDYSSLYDDGI